MTIRKDLTGQKFNRLTVTRFFGMNSSNNSMWYVECECGNVKIVAGADLSRGRPKSCGCLLIENMKIRMKKHGFLIGGDDIKRNLYQNWTDMKARCLNPNHASYKYYGGRGISVCDRWKNSFENFFDDMGYKPGKDYSLDRIDVNGGYEPQNCRWATKTQQSRNTRNAIVLEYGGSSKSIYDWAEYLNVNVETLKGRRKRGLCVEEILFKPTKLRKNPLQK